MYSAIVTGDICSLADGKDVSANVMTEIQNTITYD